MTRHARWTLALVAVVVTAMANPGPSGADGDRTPGPAARAQDPGYAQAVNAIEAGQFKTAIPLLEGVVARDERNADAYNWLGYAVRKDGDAVRAILIYQKALALDPKHRGAHEYLGEAYLMVGNVAKAKEHLAQLDKLCFFACNEFTELKNAISAYETKTVSK